MSYGYSEEPVLAHYGILKQKWGVRNGPPYPLKGGQYSAAERKAMKKTRRKYSEKNQRHFDTTIEKGTTLQTLSYDKNRTNDPNFDYFYAVYNKSDIHQMRALFNEKKPVPIYDDDGNEIGMDKCYKYEIRNEALKDMKIASEDSSVDAFAELYANNRDFYNFVTDPDRMAKYIGGTRDDRDEYDYARKALDKIQSGEAISKRDLQDVYAYFNYVLPNDGRGDAKVARDIAKQRARFFKALSEKGYSGLLDTNDSLYGETIVTNAPVIIFDTSSVVLTSAERTKPIDWVISFNATAIDTVKQAFRFNESRNRWKK